MNSEHVGTNAANGDDYDVMAELDQIANWNAKLKQADSLDWMQRFKRDLNKTTITNGFVVAGMVIKLFPDGSPSLLTCVKRLDKPYVDDQGRKLRGSFVNNIYTHENDYRHNSGIPEVRQAAYRQNQLAEVYLESIPKNIIAGKEPTVIMQFNESKGKIYRNLCWEWVERDYGKLVAAKDIGFFIEQIEKEKDALRKPLEGRVPNINSYTLEQLRKLADADGVEFNQAVQSAFDKRNQRFKENEQAREARLNEIDSLDIFSNIDEQIDDMDKDAMHNTYVRKLDQTIQAELEGSQGGCSQAELEQYYPQN